VLPFERRFRIVLHSCSCKLLILKRLSGTESNRRRQPPRLVTHEPLAKLDEVTENKQIGSSEFCKCSIRTSTTRSGSALRQRDMDPGPQFGCHQSTPIQRFRRSFASPSHEHKIIFSHRNTLPISLLAALVRFTPSKIRTPMP
jgi:hypothetical protein